MTNRRAFLKSTGVAMFGIGAVPGLASSRRRRHEPQQDSGGGVPARRCRRAEHRRALREAALRGTATHHRSASGGGPRSGRLLWFASTVAAVARPVQGEATGDHACFRFAGLTRSHFDAQDYMESGTPGRKSTADGWAESGVGFVTRCFTGARCQCDRQHCRTLPRCAARGGRQQLVRLPDPRPGRGDRIHEDVYRHAGRAFA